MNYFWKETDSYSFWADEELAIVLDSGLPYISCSVIDGEEKLWVLKGQAWIKKKQQPGTNLSYFGIGVINYFPFPFRGAWLFPECGT